MKYSQKQIQEKIFLLLLTALFIIGCNENTTPLVPPVDESSIEIDFPIGKKAIYAVGSYIKNDDSLENYFLSIYSLQFNRKIIKDNSVEYLGVVERYNPPFAVDDSLSGMIYPEHYGEGRILISVENNWVLLQNSEVIDATMIFMKRASVESDTTDIPNYLYVQFPVFPSKLTPNTTYSVVRPGDETNFLETQKHFEVENSVEWDDVYSSDSGFSFSTEYIIKWENDFVLNYSGIIDEKGIVISSTTIDDFVIGGTLFDPEGTDTTSLHIINRRIVDFTNPDYTNELSWYADYVKENGLVLY